MARGWELIGSKIDMDTPTPVGRYLGCDHIARTSTLRKGDHPFAHVFDKNVPDPAAKPARVAAKEDYTEFTPRRRHSQTPCPTRKALYQPHEAEASAYELGRHRYTHFTDVGKPDVVHELWDDNTNRSKRGELWTGVTYICSGSHDRASAMAAVKRIRDKNGAKKEAKRQAFYDINQLSDNKGCMFRPVREVIYDMSCSSNRLSTNTSNSLALSSTSSKRSVPHFTTIKSLAQWRLRLNTKESLLPLRAVFL